MKLRFSTSDLSAAHPEVSDKEAKVSEAGDNLQGPGSGAKGFKYNDPDGNQVIFEQS